MAILETFGMGKGWGLSVLDETGVKATYFWNVTDGISRIVNASHFLRLTKARSILCPRPTWAVAEIVLAQREAGALPVTIVSADKNTRSAVQAAATICSCQPLTFSETCCEYQDEFIKMHMQASDRVKLVLLNSGQSYTIISNSNQVQVRQMNAELAPLTTLHSSSRLLAFRDMRRHLCGHRFLPPIATPSNDQRRLYTLDSILEQNPDFVHEDTFAQTLKEVQAHGALADCDQKHLNSSLQFIFLGTGASRSSSRRAQSAILVQFSQGGPRCLFDCGAGTLDQLHTELGVDETNQMLADLNLIWISHRHWDHCGGLLSLLEATFKARSPLECGNNNRTAAAFLRNQKQLPTLASVPKERLPLLLVAPRCVLQLIQNSLSMNNQLRTEVLEGAKPRNYHSGISLTSIRVTHCRDAYAVVVRYNRELFAFSGDCRPSEALANEIRCDAHLYKETRILIHEATFSDDHQDQAIAKKHSTISEAIQIATQANATALILTHFSQRYLALQETTLTTPTRRLPIVAAFDGLRLSANELLLFAAVSRHCESTISQFKNSSNFFNRKRPRNNIFVCTGASTKRCKKRPTYTEKTPLAPRQRCIQRRLLAFYELHAPNKLSDIPSLLPLFDRNFPSMNAKLERKYGSGILDPSLEDENEEQEALSHLPSVHKQEDEAARKSPPSSVASDSSASVGSHDSNDLDEA